MEIAIIGGGTSGSLNIRVEELTGDRPFERLDGFISQEELRALSDQYKRVAGYSIDELAAPARC